MRGAIVILSFIFTSTLAANIPVRVVYGHHNVELTARNLHEKLSEQEAQEIFEGHKEELRPEVQYNAVRNLEEKVQLSLDELSQASKHLPKQQGTSDAVAEEIKKAQEIPNEQQEATRPEDSKEQTKPDGSKTEEPKKEDLKPDQPKQEELKPQEEPLQPAATQLKSVIAPDPSTREKIVVPEGEQLSTSSSSEPQEAQPDDNWHSNLILQQAEEIINNNLSAMRKKLKQGAINKDTEIDELTHKIKEHFNSLKQQPHSENNAVLLNKVLHGIQNITKNTWASANGNNKQIWQNFMSFMNDVISPNNSSHSTVLSDTESSTQAGPLAFVQQAFNNFFNNNQQTAQGDENKPPNNPFEGISSFFTGLIPNNQNNNNNNNQGDTTAETTGNPFQTFVSNTINTIGSFIPGSGQNQNAQGDDQKPSQNNPLQGFTNQVQQTISGIIPGNNQNNQNTQGDEQSPAPTNTLQNIASQVTQGITNFLPGNNNQNSQGDEQNPAQGPIQNVVTSVQNTLSNLNPFNRPNSENNPVQEAQNQLEQIAGQTNSDEFANRPEAQGYDSNDNNQEQQPNETDEQKLAADTEHKKDEKEQKPSEEEIMETVERR